MAQFQSVIEDFEVFLQRDCRPWQLLLININKVAQLRGTVQKDQLPVVLKIAIHKNT